MSYYLDKTSNFVKQHTGYSLKEVSFLTVFTVLFVLLVNKAWDMSQSQCKEHLSNLSSEQQSLLLENVSRSERANPTNDPEGQLGILGQPISKRDTGFLLDEGSMEGLLVHNTKCSKSCCGQQWPVPHDIDRDPASCRSKDKYVPTNITCANEYTTGCACISKKLWNFLAAKGGNGSYPYQRAF